MKILHVAETIKGGVATVLRTLISYQCRDESDSVVCLIPDQHLRELGEIADSSVHAFHRTGRNPRSMLAMAIAFCRLLLRERPDIVHIHSTFAGVVCRVLLFVMRPIHRVRVVYCSHGWAFTMDVSPMRRFAYELVERALLKITDVAICVSEFERRVAMDAGLGQAKLRVVYNGVPQIADAVPSGPRDGGEAIQLLYVGRLDHQKGFDLLAKAMEKLPADRFHLTVVGDFVGSQSTIADRDNVTYVGWLPSAEIPSRIVAADALVMPSRWEAFGLVAVEAQRFGLPVIAANVCSLPEIVEDGRTGILFPPNCSSAIAEVLQRCTIPELRRMGGEALASTARFTVEEMGLRTREAYAA